MRYRYILLFLAIGCIAASLSSGAQNNNTTLFGKIVDQRNKSPLSGATIHINGTTHEVTTDNQGNFRFVTGQKVPLILRISFVGFKTKEVPVSVANHLDIELEEFNSQLNEVVVVGYGAQNRKAITGSVATVNADEIRNKPVASFDQQLQGKAAGVQVTAGTGVPGDGLFFRIRGTTSINASNDPLYVVDGVFINSQSLQKITTQGQANNPLADINPADIQSVSILKDATATAIYGARAANGVVVITTKRGAYNTKPKINANVYTGWAWAPKLWHLVSGPEHATIINEAWRNDGKPFAGRPFRPKPEGGRGLPEEQPTYDRLHDIFRTGVVQNYDLSLAGGNNQTRYYLGGGYTKQQANIRTNDYQRASFKVNIDQKINDIFTVGTSNTMSASFRTNARVGDGPQGGILQAALHTPTYLPKFNDDGSYAKWAGFDNLDVLIKNTDMHSTSTRYIGNLYAEAEPLRNLKFRTSWSLDYNDYNEYQYWNSLTNLGSANHGFASSSISKNIVWINEQTISYRTSFHKHNAGFLAGNTIQGNTASQTFAQGSNFPNDSYKQIASAATTTSSSTLSDYNLVSYFSRLDYNFASRYYLEVNFRADASSRFGIDHRWGYFPSAGASWRLKEEAFLHDVSLISDLKLRGSYGITGNQNGIGNFASRGLWGAGANYLDNPGTVPQQLANPDLRWETTEQANLGLDLALLNNRVSIEFNVYSKYTTGLLLNVPLAQTSGYTSITKNEGEMSNRGFELGINTTNIDSKNFRWQTSLNLSSNVNKIEKLPIPKDASYSTERMVQGYSMNSFYVYRQLYVDLQTGDAVYEDLNKDGRITTDDKQIIGNALPKLYGGLSNNFQLNGFDLSVFFNFQYGNKLYNNNRYFLESGGTRDDRRAINKNQLNRWQKPGDITEVPRVTTIGNNYSLTPISRFIEDGSFLRLSTLNLGYRIPGTLTGKIGISSGRVYVIGSNLWLLKRYSGPDPEINVTADPNVQGYDLGTPPIPRSIQFGINLTL